MGVLDVIVCCVGGNFKDLFVGEGLVFFCDFEMVGLL